MADDMQQDLFGTDSEDEPVPHATSAQKGKAAAIAEADDDDDDDFQDKPAPAQPASLMRSDEEDDEDMPGIPSDEEPEVTRGPPLDITVAEYHLPASASLSLVRLPNTVSINSEPWSRETFDHSTETYTDQNGETRPHLGNTIRWRELARPNGTTKRESNSRFVQWSDGTRQLMVGDEVLDVKESDIAVDQSFLYARQQGILQAVAQLKRRWALQPASLKSRLHVQLASAMDKQHVKQNKVKHTATVQDPGREKDKRAQERERTIRSKDVLTRRQDREMRKYSFASPGLRHARAQGVTATYLEENDEDEFEDDSLTPSERAHSSLRRPQADAAAEAQAAKRLSSAKREAPSKAGPPAAKRARPAASSDEALSDQDRDEDGPLSDAEEAPKLKARRAVVLSDEEDE